MSAAAPSSGLASRWVSRPFLTPSADVLLIGGGASLLLGVALAFTPGAGSLLGLHALPTLVLLANASHFSASTVRLYSKPDSRRLHPFVTLGLPLAAVVVLAFGLLAPGHAGRHLFALYLTWSPYHYAAQTYGLAVMYCLRAGRPLAPGEKRWLRAACLLPFLHAFLASPVAGLAWVLPQGALEELPGARPVWEAALLALSAAALLAPAAVSRGLARGGARAPLIVPLLLLTNGIWWVLFPYFQAFVWATVFHGIQYLAIVLAFHVKDRMARPGNRTGPLQHAFGFYAACLVLAYGLFYCWPWAWVWIGFGLAESMLLVTAVINVHHFIVDAFIWRQGRGDSNYGVVTGTAG